MKNKKKTPELETNALIKIKTVSRKIHAEMLVVLISVLAAELARRTKTNKAGG